MISQSSRSPNEAPNISTVFVHKREHFETYQAHLQTTDPSTYRYYTLKEVLEFINSFDELTQNARDTHGILERSSSITSSEKLLFQNELRRICELSESVTTNLNQVVDQICMGKKSPKTFRAIEPSISLLRRLVDRVVSRLNLIIDQELTFD